MQLLNVLPYEPIEVSRVLTLDCMIFRSAKKILHGKFSLIDLAGMLTHVVVDIYFVEIVNSLLSVCIMPAL